MESQDSQFSIATNWSVCDGCSLSNVISFESLDLPLKDTCVSSSAKLPLRLLQPPSPDPPPCEIKICFTKKHEVLQVYVRSSARVYEIYYAADAQSSNDYLCTVHCCIVADYGDTPTNIDEEAPDHLITSCKRVAEESGKENNGSNNEEDDWVDVRHLDSSSHSHGNNSLQNKNAANIGTAAEVLYEATAQICDANPCISLTLRLLSLGNKRNSYVGEIYIYAVPSESIDLESKTDKSAQCSLETLLIPALMQLSKTSRANGKHVCSSTQEHKSEESGSCLREWAEVSDKIQEMEDLPTSIGSQTLPEVSGNKGKQRCSSCGQETPMQNVHPKSSAAEQLVSGLARVEDICLRLENKFETRLQHMEERLEALNWKFVSKSCTPNSWCNRQTNLASSPTYFAPELNSESEKIESGTSRSSYQSLVVAAPEFKGTDDGKGNHHSALEFVNKNSAATPGFMGTCVEKRNDCSTPETVNENDISAPEIVGA